MLSRLSYAYDYTPTGGTSTDGSKRRSVTELGGNVTTYTYDDPVGRLTRATTKTSGGSTLDDYVYVYDAAGNRRSKTVNGTPTTYRYNKANQLCWSIEAATSNSCANPPTGATTYTYDARGNQTAAGSLPFEYDVRDRTTKIGTAALGYLSLGQGELVSEGSRGYTNNLLGIASTTSGGQTTWFRHRPAGQPIAQKTGTTRSYFLTDALGSTTAVLNSSGNVVRSYQYTPDGEDTTSGTGTSTILRYAGGHKTDSGLYHYGARFYDPGIARWTQPDPLDQTGDLREANRYLYAGGDPINHRDLSGEHCLTCAFWEGVSEAQEDFWETFSTTTKVVCTGYSASAAAYTGYKVIRTVYENAGEYVTKVTTRTLVGSSVLLGCAVGGAVDELTG